MSGPIVRTGASPEFSKNWDRIFGGKTRKQTAAKSAASKTTAGKTAAKAAKKPAKAAKSSRAKKK